MMDQSKLSFPETAIIILAAGSSSRLGSPKQLLKWSSKTLLEHAIDEALEVTAKHVLVILGAHHEQIRSKTNRQQVEYIVNENWENGMGSSIAASTKHVSMHYPAIQYILIMLCDQPAVESHYLTRLLEIANKSDLGITATDYDDQPGVPAVFSKKYFDPLMQMKNTGARKLMKSHLKDLMLINPGFDIADIDTKEDYECLSKREND